MVRGGSAKFLAEAIGVVGRLLSAAAALIAKHNTHWYTHLATFFPRFGPSTFFAFALASWLFCARLDTYIVVVC